MRTKINRVRASIVLGIRQRVMLVDWTKALLNLDDLAVNSSFNPSSKSS